jgi:Spy/CpxP family protein refolding chaperone
MKKTLIAILIVMGLISVLSAQEKMGDMGKKCDSAKMGMPMDKGCYMPDMMKCQMTDNMFKDKAEKMGNHWAMIVNKLDLTEAQKTKIEKLNTDHQKKIIQLEADLDIQKVDQRNAHRNQDFAQNKKITAKIYDLKKQIALEKVNHQENVWKELTEEQRKEMKEVISSHTQKKTMMPPKEHCQGMKNK